MADETTSEDSGTTIRFEVSGRTMEFDADPQRLMGDEAMLIDDHAGSANSWISRMLSSEYTSRDLLLLAYLGAHRENPQLEWRYFVRGVAPYSMKILEIAGVKLSHPGSDEPDPPPAELPAKPPAKPRASRARKAEAAAAN